METFNYADKRWVFETTNKKEILFKHFVEKYIIGDYKRDLKEIGVSDNYVEMFEDVFYSDEFSEREKEMFCTVPYEIRLRQFESFFNKNNIPKNKMSRKDCSGFIKHIIDLNIDLDPHLGFHVTPFFINKIKNQKSNRESWNIKGTEQDHRNNDQPMAYYSLSLERLFRKKEIKKIYVVRANLSEGSNHYPDNDGHWGRSGSLSIVSEIEFSDEEERALDMDSDNEDQVVDLEQEKKVA